MEFVFADSIAQRSVPDDELSFVLVTVYVVAMHNVANAAKKTEKKENFCIIFITPNH